MFGWFKKSGPEAVKVDLSTPEESQERRAVERRNTYADIVAVSDGGRNKKRGIVLDLSDTGARVRLEGGDKIVDGMTLKIPRYGITCQAEARWTRHNDIGIVFVD